jgi:hypothetical protein
VLFKIKKLYSWYNDDLNTLYNLYKNFVSAAINDIFSDYIKQINDEQDEKAKRKLQIVEVTYSRAPASS